MALTPLQFAKMTKVPGIVIPVPHITQEIVDAYDAQSPEFPANPHDRARSILGSQVVGAENLPKKEG